MKGHPYTRYAEALIRVRYGLSVADEITITHLQTELERGLQHFKLKPTTNFEGKDEVKYEFVKELEHSTAEGYFLAPNIISSEKNSRHTWNAVHDLLSRIKSTDLDKYEAVGMSTAPTAGEFLSFSEKAAGRGRPKISFKAIVLNAICSITEYKPCFQHVIVKREGSIRENTCIIPDLPLAELMNFIAVYGKLMISKSSPKLLIGRVQKKVEKTRKGANVTFTPMRPQIFRGNFPNPPLSSSLGSIALLGAIGEVAKEGEVSSIASSVLDSLKNATLYSIKYGDATTFKYHHHVIELAKTGDLRKIVNAIYFSRLYNEGERTNKSTEYQKFDFFASRFLQLFNKSTFRNFISFKAQYEPALKILFNVYFTKMEMIDPKIVSSARTLGRWLNQVAYYAAKGEIPETSKTYWEDIRKVKSKVLVELESSAFSAKTGDGLIAQVIARAGRLSSTDAPEGAALFMEKAATGELSLENAKNLLIAFSRLRNKAEQNESPKSWSEPDDTETEDFSNE